MTHVRDLIHRSLEGDIAADEQLQLDQHLGVCDMCRELSAELRRNDVLLARREPLPAIPPGRMPGRHPLAFVRPALLGVAALVFALVAGTQLAEWRASTGSVASGTPAPPAVTGRGDVGVCAAARHQVWGVTRLDRIESKRMSMKDLMDGAGGDWPTRWTTQPEATLRSMFVCVVAVSGEIRQQLGLVDTPPHKWGLFFSVAGSNETIGTTLGSGGNWPPYFDALPNRWPLSPYPGYVVEIVGPQAVRVKLESPMMSQEFGNLALLQADKFTEIIPSAPTIVATGVKVGDRVGVWFEREGRDSTTGAYTLSIFEVLTRAAPRPTTPATRDCTVSWVKAYRTLDVLVQDAQLIVRATAIRQEIVALGPGLGAQPTRETRRTVFRVTEVLMGAPAPSELAVLEDVCPNLEVRAGEEWSWRSG